MQPEQLIECIRERDVDLLLLEELNVSADFRSWFVEKVFGSDVRCTRFISAEHSVVCSILGESDLLFQFEAAARGMVAVLIENKINAIAQPDQAARYFERGNVGIAEGRWAKFQTCLTAPNAYLDSNADAKLYGARISYESIEEWFQQRGSNDARSKYRARFMGEAIEQHRRGYVLIPHEGVTKFWTDYWQLVRDKFQELQMKQPGPIPARSDWPVFRNPKLGSTRRIVHKLADGYVDLEIGSAGDQIEEIAARNRDVLTDGLELAQTGKSASVRIRVPVVDRSRDLHPQIDAVRSGLLAARRLLELSARIDAG